MSQLTLTKTADGSHSLRNEALQEHYHSQHGAIQEAEHVFLQSGLAQMDSKSINILEFGFGTGLNVLLTAIAAKSENRAIHYQTLENTILPEEIWKVLNFPELLKFPHARDLFSAIHNASWDIPVSIDPKFTLEKRQVTFEDAILSENHFDLIFFDAFAPRYHPTAWDEPVLKKCYDALKANGIWVTYCAQGAVKRRLQSVGFSVEKIPGPPGKREMLRGTKTFTAQLIPQTNT
ncbi:MAG: tRNA (5-methylaminomethyl-2-thiouridine)(34)-methyltransferase MnmD [Cryomorphaceae bacterium]|nr:tRNA (5-methylaminomethyl-2-thiouridine)(34)-methyltransferase MnmD [Cryomorphaceae bacterium]